MPTQTLTLTEFLLARIAEDEAAARGVDQDHRTQDAFSLRFLSWESDHTDGDSAFVDRFNPTRVLAECEAKRGVVEDLARFLSVAVAAGVDDHPTLLAGLTLQIQRLAAPYADHPDYREEWKP